MAENQIAEWALGMSVVAILLSGGSLWLSFRVAKRAQDLDYAELRTEFFQLVTELQTMSERNSLEANLLKKKTDDKELLLRLEKVAAESFDSANQHKEFYRILSESPVPSPIKTSHLIDLKAIIGLLGNQRTKCKDVKSLLEKWSEVREEEHGGGGE